MTMHEIERTIVKHAIDSGEIDRSDTSVFIDRQAWNMLQHVVPLAIWQDSAEGPGRTEWCQASRMAIDADTWTFYCEKLSKWLNGNQ
jgi:hypothetical protein